MMPAKFGITADSHNPTSRTGYFFMVLLHSTEKSGFAIHLLAAVETALRHYFLATSYKLLHVLVRMQASHLVVPTKDSYL